MNKKYVNTIIIIFFVFFVTGFSKISFSLDNTLKKFEWEKRILLIIAKSENEKIILETKKFFEKYTCGNNERNLKLITVITSKIETLKIPKKFRNRYGILLIGYDGKEKAYSKDSSLLNQLHNIIDSMPIRLSEMIGNKSKCN